VVLADGEDIMRLIGSVAKSLASLVLVQQVVSQVKEISFFCCVSNLYVCIFTNHFSGPSRAICLVFVCMYVYMCVATIAY